jgi:hypothetical protein
MLMCQCYVEADAADNNDDGEGSMIVQSRGDDDAADSLLC